MVADALAGRPFVVLALSVFVADARFVILRPKIKRAYV